MQGYDRQSSFYKVTFHWVEVVGGRPCIQKKEELHPGQNNEIVRRYFSNDPGVLVETSPYWFDLLEIVDADVGVGFQFEIGTFDSSGPGFGYLYERYDDFVKERENAYRQGFE